MIKQDLKVASNNSVSTYMPLRTKDKHYKFDWDIVLGYFIHRVYQKKQHESGLSEFKELCQKLFEEKLDEADFWEVIQNIYFKKGHIFKIAPEFLTLKSSLEELDANNRRLGDMYTSLLAGFTLPSSPDSNLNFIEKEFKREFERFSDDDKNLNNLNNGATPYLPFLTELFKKDLQFVNTYPQYLLNNLDSFLKLYGFLYVSQMALNIRSWQTKPSAKPCFLILDTEKASNERIKIKSFGYSQLRVHLEYLFPYLAMNESVQEKGNVEPIWKLALYLAEHEGHLSDLENYTLDFIEKRDLPVTVTVNTVDSTQILGQLLNLSFKQFERGATRYQYNQTAVKGLLNTVCKPFMQKRGRAGQVLTLNQDYLVLLTNLTIGEKEKLRLYELLKGFEARGIFLDKQSQQCLVELYERMGNVERMSDSGDAVYVKKTV